MPKRLFIAIPIAEEIKKELEKYQRYFYIKGLRWTPAKNLHITALFLGEVEEEKIPFISSKLSDAVFQTQSFKLHLESVKLAPNFKKPNMVWAKFARSTHFDKLVKNLKNEIGRVIPLKPARQELIAHATLARFRNIGQNLRSFPAIRRPRQPVDPEVKKILLMESELRREGAAYRVIENFDLKN